jgi:hypothetical protein
MAKSTNKATKGRIAERIVANELEYRGFRVTNLNREGVEANADLLAAKDGKIWQVQVKGADNAEEAAGDWWFQYGFCNENIIARKEKMFNRGHSFYSANVVILLAIRSPRDYCCVVLPLDEADEAAECNLDFTYRRPRADGQPRKPHMVWCWLKPRPGAKKERVEALEYKILDKYKENSTDAFSSEGASALTTTVG